MQQGHKQLHMPSKMSQAPSLEARLVLALADGRCGLLSIQGSQVCAHVLHAAPWRQERFSDHTLGKQRISSTCKALQQCGTHLPCECTWLCDEPGSDMHSSKQLPTHAASGAGPMGLAATAVQACRGCHAIPNTV